MKKSKMPLWVLLLATTVPPTNVCLAWGKAGHQIIAELAFNMLTEQTRLNALHSLGGYSIGEGAAWMDEERGGGPFPFMKPWHYIEYPDGASLVSARKPNIVGVLNDALSHPAKQKQLPPDMAQQALLLFGIIGDTHQPPHSGYPAGKEGNEAFIEINGNKESLHRVWDDEIIGLDSITVASCTELYNSLGGAEKKTGMQQPSPEEWGSGTRPLLGNVYQFGSPKHIGCNKTLVELQLLRAAEGLAQLLEMDFAY